MNSWLPGMLDAVLQATFLCALLMFWLCIYHGLRQNERRFVRFYLPKIIVVLPIWLCAIVLATWEKCNELKDPTYSHFVDTKNYNVSKMKNSIIIPYSQRFISGFQNVFLYCWINVHFIFGHADFEGLHGTKINAIFW